MLAPLANIHNLSLTRPSRECVVCLHDFCCPTQLSLEHLFSVSWQSTAAPAAHQTPLLRSPFSGGTATTRLLFGQFGRTRQTTADGCKKRINIAIVCVGKCVNSGGVGPARPHSARFGPCRFGRARRYDGRNKTKA